MTTGKLLVFIIASAVFLRADAQMRYLTREGKIYFDANTPLEKVEARSHKAASVLDPSTGSLQVNVLMKSFIFEKDLMQQHFNENYVESDKYPKAVFKAKIDNLAEVDFSKNGEYKVSVTGKMELHGVTRDITVPGALDINGESVTARAELIIKPEDYNIKIPGLVRNKIAREVKVNIELTMKPLTP